MNTLTPSSEPSTKTHPYFKDTFDVFTEREGSDIYQVSRSDIGRIIAGLPTELPERIEQRIYQKYNLDRIAKLIANTHEALP